MRRFFFLLILKKAPDHRVGGRAELLLLLPLVRAGEVAAEDLDLPLPVLGGDDVPLHLLGAVGPVRALGVGAVVQHELHPGWGYELPMVPPIG